MPNLIVNMSYGLDPDMIGVGTEFFIVAGKYAIIFGICGFLMKMLIRAFTGKERFL
ncbi:MAG: hypothetical protein ACI4IR_04395 [Eubacterium sp.]